MKVLQINATSGIGSTGKICVAVSERLDREGIENYILYSALGVKSSAAVKCSSTWYIKLQALKSRIFGNYGFNSHLATLRIIKKLEEIKPDIVHLHNIHGHDCQLSMLFKYFKRKNQKLYWTFHDCWAFTGYCPHFDMIGCDRWKSECENCPQRKSYSWFFDKSNKNFRLKRKLFSGLDLTIITPSNWLAGLVKQSFLKDCPVKVINNGIDLSIFKPTPSEFRKKYDIEDKFILLGVAFCWDKRKGLDVFVELSKTLDSKYKIVLVGTDESIDKVLPENIISIHSTQNQTELAEIYTAADLFINPTREEVLGLVNIEALACGTPVVTFNTGGSPECIDGTCGTVVEKDDIDALVKEIERIYKEKPFGHEACLQKARNFDKVFRYDEYIELYC